MMLYTIKAYSSRKAGESGRVSPVNTCKTGDWTLALREAKVFAAFYGAAVIVNNESGERHWF